MNVQGKVWGSTRCLLRTPLFEVWRIDAIDGGYCSRHRHQSKHNWFYVMGGRLRVRTWTSRGLADETDLGPGQCCVVAPGLWHQFEALAETQALEVYWAALDPCDIQRVSCGGAKGSRLSGRR